MKKYGSDADEVIAGDPDTPRGNGHNPNQPSGVGITNPEYWERDFDQMSFLSKIEKILEFPGIDDMAGATLRSVIKDDRQLNAIIRLYYRHRKFHDDDHQEMLRIKLAGLASMGGVARLEALFAATNLIAPDMYRTARGLPRAKSREDVRRGSDFREKRDEGGHE